MDSPPDEISMPLQHNMPHTAIQLYNIPRIILTIPLTAYLPNYHTIRYL